MKLLTFRTLTVVFFQWIWGFNPTPSALENSKFSPNDSEFAQKIPERPGLCMTLSRNPLSLAMTLKSKAKPIMPPAAHQWPLKAATVGRGKQQTLRPGPRGFELLFRRPKMVEINRARKGTTSLYVIFLETSIFIRDSHGCSSQPCLICLMKPEGRSINGRCRILKWRYGCCTVPYKAIYFAGISPYIGLKNRPHQWISMVGTSMFS